MRVVRPRKEFVGLARFPMPVDLFEFMNELDEAVGIARIQHQQRYGGIPRFFIIWVQRGRRVISRLKIAGHGFEVHIEQWSVNRLSGLYDIGLQWRYLQHGKLLTYIEKSTDTAELSEDISPEKVIFRTRIDGSVGVKEVMRAEGFKMPEIYVGLSTTDRMKLFAKGKP